MIDDFVPIIHKLDGRSIKVYPIADVHLGSKECDLEGFENHLKKIAKERDSYVVLVGDICNNATKDSLSNVYEDVMPPIRQIEKAVELLDPIKDKILGAVGGNHEARSRKAVDLDPMYTIMCMLGPEYAKLYRSNFAIMRIRLTNGKSYDSYSIMLIHGKTENKKRQFAYALEGIDVLITAHTHTGIVEKPARLVFNQRNSIVVKELISITATSWLNWGGYAAAGLYKPVATSSPQYLVLEYVNSNDICGKISVVW